MRRRGSVRYCSEASWLSEPSFDSKAERLSVQTETLPTAVTVAARFALSSSAFSPKSSPGS
eukprot:scaffold98174_cov48-Phaeocystis_antarctica.AAC.2